MDALPFLTSSLCIISLHFVFSAMASFMRQPSEISMKLVPVIHYGLINIDVKADYKSGGFSRVYIGTYRKMQKVAVKLLFAVELTPDSIIEVRICNTYTCIYVCFVYVKCFSYGH